jgi:hypothetical protein
VKHCYQNRTNAEKKSIFCFAYNNITVVCKKQKPNNRLGLEAATDLYTENAKELKVTKNWVEFVVRGSALSLKYGYFYLL